MLPRLFVAATIGLLLALVMRPAALSDDEWETNGALIWFADIRGIYVREHDDSWTTWIAGAPEIVNGTFLSKYGTRIVEGPPPPTPAPAPAPASTPTPAPTPTATPTAAPTPTAAQPARGFTISGQGPGATEVEASGHLVCSAEVTGNRMESGRPDGFGVNVSGTGLRPRDGRIGLQRTRVSAWVGYHQETAAGELPPKVIYFGEFDGEERPRSLLAPYTLGVGVAPRGEWTVRCDPVDPLPEARGFEYAVRGDTSGRPPHLHVLGEGIIDLPYVPAGRLACYVEFYGVRGEGQAKDAQWAVWGRDADGEPTAKISNGAGTQYIWFGAARPGQWPTFNPPYGVEVWMRYPLTSALIKCEPA